MSPPRAAVPSPAPNHRKFVRFRYVPLTLGLLIWAAFQLGTLYRRSPEAARQQAVKDPAADSQMRALLRRVEALEGEVRPQSAEVRSSQEQSVARASVAKPNEEPIDRGPEEQERRHAAWEAKLSEIANTAGLDTRWSKTVSSSLREQMAQHSTQISLTAAECGPKLCLIEIEHQDPDAHAALWASLSNQELPPEGFGGPALIRRHDLGDGRYSTSIYLAKPGEALPEMDAP